MCSQLPSEPTVPKLTDPQKIILALSGADRQLGWEATRDGQRVRLVAFWVGPGRVEIVLQQLRRRGILRRWHPCSTERVAITRRWNDAEKEFTRARREMASDGWIAVGNVTGWDTNRRAH